MSRAVPGMGVWQPLQSLMGHVLLHFHPSSREWEASSPPSTPPTSTAMLLVGFANTLNAQLPKLHHPTEILEAAPGTSVTVLGVREALGHR